MGDRRGTRAAMAVAIGLGALGILAIIYGREVAAAFYSRRLLADPALFLEAVEANEGSIRHAGLLRCLRSEAGGAAFLDVYLRRVIECPAPGDWWGPLELAETAMFWHREEGGFLSVDASIASLSGGSMVDGTLERMQAFLGRLEGRKLRSAVRPHLELEVVRGDRGLEEWFESNPHSPWDFSNQKPPPGVNSVVLIASARVVRPMEEILGDLTSPSTKRRLRSLRDLGVLRSSEREAVQAVARALGDPVVADPAKVVLLRLGQAAIPVLEESLPLLEPEARERASEVLFGLRAADEPPGARLERILGELQSASEPQLRACAILELAKLGPAARGALPRVREALSDPDEVVRRSAAYALRKIEGK